MFNLTSYIFKHKGIILPKISVERFPYPKFVYDSLLSTLGDYFFFGFLFMAIFLYACVSMVKSITLDKEKQLKVSSDAIS